MPKVIKLGMNDSKTFYSFFDEFDKELLKNSFSNNFDKVYEISNIAETMRNKDLKTYTDILNLVKKENILDLFKIFMKSIEFLNKSLFEMEYNDKNIFRFTPFIDRIKSINNKKGEILSKENLLLVNIIDIDKDKDIKLNYLDYYNKVFYFNDSVFVSLNSITKYMNYLIKNNIYKN